MVSEVSDLDLSDLECSDDEQEDTAMEQSRTQQTVPDSILEPAVTLNEAPPAAQDTEETVHPVEEQLKKGCHCVLL